MALARSPRSLLRNKWVQLFAALLALLELYNHGAVPAFITTQKSIETQAVADNAALRQKAEAELAEWKSLTETQIATYAARKQSAEARKATGEARENSHQDHRRRDGEEFGREGESGGRSP